MTDLHDRFRSLDRIPGPDVWSDATRRAETVGAERSDWLRNRSSALMPILLVTVVIVAALVGIGLLPDSGVGDSPIGTASPSSVPSPTMDILPAGPGGGALDRVAAGRYRLYGPQSGRIPPGWPDTVIVTFPDGWSFPSPNGDGATLKRYFDVVASPLLAELTFSVVATVTADPCATGEGGRSPELDPPVGPGVDDLVAGLRSLPVEFTEPADVTLDGWPGKRLELTHPDNCGIASLWQARPVSLEWWVVHSRPGWHTTVWILDVAGDRFAITAGYASDAPADVQSDLEQMVESIDLEP